MDDNLKKIVLLLFVIAVFAVGYKGAQILRPEGFLVNTLLDNFVPFLDYFVVFYILYFPLLLLPVTLYWGNWDEYKWVLASFLIAILISVGIYLTFQTEVVRPEISDTNIFTKLVLELYKNDRTVNALPSLHVSLSLLAVFFTYKKTRLLGILSLPLGMLIMASTVFIKQHAVLDVIGGILLASFVFWLFRKRVF